jgi:hypothetical protein
MREICSVQVSLVVMISWAERGIVARRKNGRSESRKVG